MSYKTYNKKYASATGILLSLLCSAVASNAAVVSFASTDPSINDGDAFAGFTQGGVTVTTANNVVHSDADSNTATGAIVGIALTADDASITFQEAGPFALVSFTYGEISSSVGGASQITISGVDASGAAIAGEVFAATTSATLTATNLASFQNVSSITVTASGDAGGPGFLSFPEAAVINGFETQSVPEPSSTALLGLGALAFISRRKR